MPIKLPTTKFAAFIELKSDQQVTVFFRAPKGGDLKQLALNQLKKDFGTDEEFVALVMVYAETTCFYL